MKFSDPRLVHQARQPLNSVLVTHDGRLGLASQAIVDRWPDIVPKVGERDRLIILERVVKAQRKDEWDGIKLQDVLIAARVAFVPEQIDQTHLSSFREFLIEQVELNSNPSLLRVMFGVYLISYQPRGAHTYALARSIEVRVGRLRLADRQLLLRLPQLLDAERAPELIAKLLCQDADPGAKLLSLGLRDVYATGLMRHLHFEVIECFRDPLSKGEASALERYIKWLQPGGKKARELGAGVAIDAALTPWLKQPPPDSYQTLLIQGLVNVYGDPRLSTGKAWSEASDEARTLMTRWLTGSTMMIFLDAISRSNDEGMWVRRKEFWMQMYEAEHIDEAWVAFSEAAHRTARSMATTDEERSLFAGFGRQSAGGGRTNTSLLIMRIGERVIVEGSHNYKVQLFERGNPHQPAMYKSSYNCNEIRKLSDDQKPHISGGSWKSWVREKVL